jgi:hypothetical protein
MEMSFFAACHLTGGLSVPRKSGHTRNADLTIMQHGGRCPDLSGSACALLKGHETKKDILMLNHIVSFIYNLGAKRRGHLLGSHTWLMKANETIDSFLNGTLQIIQS